MLENLQWMPRATTSTCRHADSRALPAHPDRQAQRRRKAGLLAPGSLLSSAFPGPTAQVACERSLAGYSCGDSRGLTAFPKPRTWRDAKRTRASPSMWRCVLPGPRNIFAARRSRRFRDLEAALKPLPAKHFQAQLPASWAVLAMAGISWRWYSGRPPSRGAANFFCRPFDMNFGRAGVLQALHFASAASSDILSEPLFL